MPVKRPPPLGPPKFKKGQWLFWCFIDEVKLNIGIRMIRISRVENKIWAYDYWYEQRYPGGIDEHLLFFNDKNMFLTFEEALDYCKQRIEEKRLSFLVKEGIVL